MSSESSSVLGGGSNTSSWDLRSWDPTTLLDALLGLLFLFGAIFLLCAFVTASTENIGMVTLIYGFIFIGYPIWAYIATHSYKSPVAVGSALGSGTLCVFFALMNVVYWGELSVCEKVSYTIRHYSCSSKIAYRAVCMVAIIVFILQLLYILMLAHFRGAVLKEASEYQQISNMDDNGATEPYLDAISKDGSSIRASDVPTAKATSPNTLSSVDL